MKEHIFTGSWITNREFATLEPRQMFHRQLDTSGIFPEEHLNRHILFRRTFDIKQRFEKALLYITADDYYKLYINGHFVTQGPAPAYPYAYGYNTVDISRYLTVGENVIAVHTYYQGLINRVWLSGDNRHGLLCDLELDGKVVLYSDTNFLTAIHGAYRTGSITSKHKTQFLEHYDSNAPEIGFMEVQYDDSTWKNASVKEVVDYHLAPQPTKSLVFEQIHSVSDTCDNVRRVLDFGKCYVGYLNAEAVGQKGDIITIRCGQELNPDGTVRYDMRCKCVYEETWTLSGKRDKLNWFDYKAFRYVELVVPETCNVENVYLTARHYPFELKAKLKPEFQEDMRMRKIWELCVNTLQYGVQEVIQDCMDREKGFYLGDGCYTALAHMILTEDDSMVRYLIDSAFLSTRFVNGMVTCLNCSYMQEIAEFPLIMVSLILWHYRLTGDRTYLEKNYVPATKLLDSYRRDYEQDFLLQNLDKWCVVEWPANYRDGYNVDLTQRQICKEAHMVINAYYIEAISTLNKIAAILGKPLYRGLTEIKDKFWDSFYDEKRHIFKDGVNTTHSSYISNVFAFGFELMPDEESKETIWSLIQERGISNVSLFGAFPLLAGLIRNEKAGHMKQFLLDEGAWLRMLREDTMTTFEGWGKACKENASLFHLTLSYAAVFLADIEHGTLFL